MPKIIVFLNDFDIWIDILLGNSIKEDMRRIPMDLTPITIKIDVNVDKNDLSRKFFLLKKVEKSGSKVNSNNGL